MRRREFVRALGVGGLVAAAGCLDRSERDPGQQPADDATPTPAESATAWPTFGRDHRHTGVHDDGTGPQSATIAWSAIEDAPTVLCPPTVSDGTVYTGSAAEAVHAFDAETGDQRWRYDTASYVETAPAVEDETVYTADADGVIYALTTDGEERWTHETGRNFHSRAMVVHGDTLVVGTAGTMPSVVSGETDATKAGVVLGLDTGTGEQRWSWSGPENWFSGPALGGGRVYVGNHDGSVTALNPDSGEKLWQWRPSESDHAGVLAPPTYADGTVYVGVHGLGHLVALDAGDGTKRWHQPLKAPNVKSSPAVDGDRVYIGATGSESSDYDGPDEPPPTPSPTPADDDGEGPVEMPTIQISGSVFALSRADGAIEWRHETDHDFRSSPAVVGDRVYIGGGNRLLALSRSDGREQWHVEFGDFVYSSPAVDGGRAFVGSADGHLYCVGEPSGE